LTIKLEHTEGEDFTLVAYLVRRDNDPLEQGDVTGNITVNVYDLESSTPTTAAFTSTDIVANTVFNAEQTDGYATRAGLTRYNFRAEPIAVSDYALKTGGRYLVDYIFGGADVGGGDLVVHASVSVVGGLSG